MPTTVVNINKQRCDVSIMRPSIFGNRYHIGIHGDRDYCVDRHKIDFLERIENDPDFKREVLKLKNKTIGCVCKPKRCHGDNIADYLNSLDNAKTD